MEHSAVRVYLWNPTTRAEGAQTLSKQTLKALISCQGSPVDSMVIKLVQETHQPVTTNIHLKYINKFSAHGVSFI